VDFRVSHVREIKWNDAAFDSLALPGQYKHLLLAFARTQREEAAQFDDVVEGKGMPLTLVPMIINVKAYLPYLGRGMVMLLEGPPGVGKTLTIESGIPPFPFSHPLNQDPDQTKKSPKK